MLSIGGASSTSKKQTQLALPYSNWIFPSFIPMTNSFTNLVISQDQELLLNKSLGHNEVTWLDVVQSKQWLKID